MKEESQIEEMRAALRGDRERAEQTRERSFENVRALVEPQPDAAPPRAAEEPRRGLRSFLRRR